MYEQGATAQQESESDKSKTNSRTNKGGTTKWLK